MGEKSCVHRKMGQSQFNQSEILSTIANRKILGTSVITGKNKFNIFIITDFHHFYKNGCFEKI